MPVDDPFICQDPACEGWCCDSSASAGSHENHRHGGAQTCWRRSEIAKARA